MTEQWFDTTALLLYTDGMKKERKDIAKEILDHPQNFKICEVCGAVIPKSEDICPECYAYRFNEDEKEVCDRVIDLAGKPQKAVGHEGLYAD